MNYCFHYAKSLVLHTYLLEIIIRRQHIFYVQPMLVPPHLWLYYWIFGRKYSCINYQT